MDMALFPQNFICKTIQLTWLGPWVIVFWFLVKATKHFFSFACHLFNQDHWFLPISFWDPGGWTLIILTVRGCCTRGKEKAFTCLTNFVPRARRDTYLISAHNLLAALSTRSYPPSSTKEQQELSQRFKLDIVSVEEGVI